MFENKKYRPAVRAFAHAHELHPESWGWTDWLVGTMNHWDRQISAMMMRGFPSMTIHFPPPAYPSLPVDLDRGIVHMTVKENLLLDPVLKKKWWDPLRSKARRRARDLPAHIDVRFSSNSSEPPKITFYDHIPPWVDRNNMQRP